MLLLFQIFILLLLPYWIGIIFYAFAYIITYKTDSLLEFKKSGLSLFTLIFSTVVPLSGLVMLIITYEQIHSDRLFVRFTIFNFGQICWLGLIFLFVLSIARIKDKENVRIISYFLNVFIIGSTITAIYNILDFFSRPWF